MTGPNGNDTGVTFLDKTVVVRLNSAETHLKYPGRHNALINALEELKLASKTLHAMSLLEKAIDDLSGAKTKYQDMNLTIHNMEKARNELKEICTEGNAKESFFDNAPWLDGVLAKAISSYKEVIKTKTVCRYFEKAVNRLLSHNRARTSPTLPQMRSYWSKWISKWLLCVNKERHLLQQHAPNIELRYVRLSDCPRSQKALTKALEINKEYIESIKNRLMYMAEGQKYKGSGTKICNRDVDAMPDVLHACPYLEEIGQKIDLLETGPIVIDEESDWIKIYMPNLMLNEMNIESLPDEFGNHLAVCELNLFDNQLKTLPCGFRNLAVFERVDLSKNELNSLPGNIGQLIVKEIVFSENKLTSLPDDFGGIVASNLLDLSENHLMSLPENFGYIGLGGTLKLSHNKLGSLPDTFGEIECRKLELDNNGLASLPDTFGEIKCRQLDLSSNSLTSLPDTFGVGEIKCRHLDLSSNSLTSLPDTFGNLESLQHLNLASNNLRSLPDSFNLIKDAYFIDLSNNHLVSLPEGIGELTTKSQDGEEIDSCLRIYNNPLQSLPDSFTNLNVNRIICGSTDGKNYLESLPFGFEKLINKGTVIVHYDDSKFGVHYYMRGSPFDYKNMLKSKLN